MKIALVHDYLNQYGGAERVLEAFCRMFPQAPIYTLFYDAERTGYAFAEREIRTSFLQKIPGIKSRHWYFPALMPAAVEQLNLSGYDLVLSNSSGFSKGIIVSPDTLHICYCHTPLRYAWRAGELAMREWGYPSPVRAAGKILLPYLRVWDQQAAARPDLLIANSKFIQRKIKKYYRREAEIVYPPLNFHSFFIREPLDYFLIVGRLVPYKRFDIAIEAFNRLGWPLKIIGDGPEAKNLRRRAKKNIEFVGLVSEPDLPGFYTHAQALILPQEEDFGISALESMASGRPVIAYRSGGARESVRENESGLFFNKQTPDALISVLRKFRNMSFDPQFIRASVEGYDRSHFINAIQTILTTNY